MRKIFYDTNCLLHTDVEKIEGHIYISSITLQEIENIKVSSNKDNEVKYNARKVTRFLRDNEDKYTCIVVEERHYKSLSKKKLPIDNDSLIISCAMDLDDVVFYTNDLCCYNIAKNVFGLECKSSQDRNVEQYLGYKKFKGNTAEINSLFNQYMNNCFNILELVTNEYLIIENTDTNDISEYCYKQDNLEPLILPNSKVVKGVDSVQRCAIDLLNNDDIPIKVICGGFGSGKTYLATRIGINKVAKEGKYEKIMVLRNIIGSGENIGYLSGDKQEKIESYFKPIVDNLDGGQQELDRLEMNGQIEFDTPYFMKGRSLPSNYIVVDEAEDLDKQTFKLMGSRLAKNSSICFVGDYAQTEHKFKTNNGLTQFIDFAKGNPYVGIVVLDKCVRSEACSVFIDFN